MATHPWNTLTHYLRRLVGDPDMAGQSDRQLLQRFAEQHDESAFTLLVEQHGPMVLRVCQRLLHDHQEAEDAFQATFCALARRAGAVAWETSAANWLYTVAIRAAERARKSAARRREHEQEAAVMRSPTAPSDPPDCDLPAMLDVELQHLPEKYRAPLVLCYLQGQSNEEAARQLGWPKGTVQGRLARAKEMLRNRLLRRGIAVSAGAFASVLDSPVAQAALPAGLLQTTVQTSIRFAVSQATTAVVPAAVAELAKGVLRTMWITKLKIAAVLILGLFGIGAGVFLFGFPGRESRNAVAAPLPEQPRPAPQVAAVPFPDGFLDPAARTVFVGNSQGGVQAVRLDDGKVLWTNDTIQAEPWLLSGNRLIARGERIFVLDIRQDGKLLRECDAPAYPKLAAPDRCTVSFQLSSPQIDGDTLRVGWYSQAAIDRRQGRPFNFEGLNAFNQKAPAGTLTIDLSTGKVTLSTDANPGNAKTEPAKKENELPAKLAEIRGRYQSTENGRVGIIGNRLVGVSLAVESVPANPMKKITLHSWDIKTGEEAPAIELLKDKATNIADARFTLDGRHVGVMFGQSQAIYSLTTGKRVGIQVPGFTLMQMDRTFVDGNRAYFTQTNGTRLGQAAPTVLRAFDLEAGKVAWEQPIKPRNTMPLPPGAGPLPPGAGGATP